MEKAHLLGAGGGQKIETTKERFQHDPNPMTKESVIIVIKKGILEKNCPKRKSKKNEAFKKKGNVAMVLDGYDSTKVLRISTKNTKKEWVLDLGCTFHMCLIKTYLCDYQKLNCGSVYLGNNQA